MMSDFDYSLDVDDAYQDDFEEDDYEWDNDGPPQGPRGPPPSLMGPPPGPLFNSRRSNSGFMNAQYGEAFGDYRGGYGPGGGFGPPRPQPYPLFPTGMQQNQGFGPIGPRRRGPSVHRAARFLAKCHVAHQSIKMLPLELLDMIEPSYCGLCSQNLESFAVARIHYTCKNHNKAQKKFMAQHKPNRNHRQIPMKSRNLYCELCDVHITSTAHAESHYAGKSHRSIVEGRKPPKNPILLQQGMENRVSMLIKREKKMFKLAPEVEKDEEIIAPVEKNVPPELICNICKTSVTCSEQMTNHLNGKKHLTKEKQHILNMMKGKTNKKKKPAQEDTDAENAAEDDIQAEEQEDIGADETAAEDIAAEDIATDEIAGEKIKAEDTIEDDLQAEEKLLADPDTPELTDDWGAGGDADWDSHNPTEQS